MNHGAEVGDTSMTTLWLWSSATSPGSPIATGNVVANVVYAGAGLGCAAGAAGFVPTSGFAAGAGAVFDCEGCPGAGEVTGSTNLPVIASPTIWTFETLLARTWAINCEYASCSSGLDLGHSANAFQIRNNVSISHHHHKPPCGAGWLGPGDFCFGSSCRVAAICVVLKVST